MAQQDDSTIHEAVVGESANISGEVSDPIDWQKDTDELLLRKINARIDDAKGLQDSKLKDYKQADAYLNGEPDEDKPKMIYNPMFPIVRNMTGLITDARPKPSTRIVDFKDKMDKQTKEEMMSNADNLSVSLEEWWDFVRGQSKLQRIVFGLLTYADYFVMPYWREADKDACFELLKPSRVKISPNASDLEDADFATVTFYRSRQWMYENYGEKVSKDLVYHDYSELKINDEDEIDNSIKAMKNVCRLELYMEKDWWVYKVEQKLVKKLRNPYWAFDEETQRTDIKSKIGKKYEQKGLRGAINKGVDMVKGAVGMSTTQDKMMEEVNAAMAVFKPRANYFKSSKIALIQFDTYRMAGELYSRSVLKQSIEMLDLINDRKRDIKQNSESTGRPTTLIDGTLLNEEQAQKINSGRAKGEIVRGNKLGNGSLRDNLFVIQGIPLPAQFFTDVQDNKRELDNLWGHHEVSKGASSPDNKTKGGILALQEADQTPVRYITRNIEDSLQELFEWVVQIRKINRDDKVNVGDLNDDKFVDYSVIDQHYRVFLKSGSMMPVSKEAQRDEAIDLWRLQAIDPLTLHERLNDPDPEKTAQRLAAWKQGQILNDGMEDQKNRVVEKIKLIQANKFDEVQVLPDDDPQIHHDMLKMALQSNQFTPEQEQVIAQLLQQYLQLAQQGAAPPAPAGQPGQPAPAMAPEVK